MISNLQQLGISIPDCSSNNQNSNSLGNDESFINFNITGDCKNSLDWTIIDDWKMDKEYPTGSIVTFDDILYRSNTNVITTNPTKSILSKQVKSAPYNHTEWNVLNSPYLDPEDNIFWTPDYPFGSGKVIYNNGEYYYYDGTGSEDFWNPMTASNTGYDYGDVVLYKGQYYMSMTSSNSYDPNYTAPFVLSNQYQNYGYWVVTQPSNPKWEKIELWNPSKNYNTPSYSNSVYVVHNDIIWVGDIPIEAEEEPGLSSLWERKYSLEPDTNFVYPIDPNYSNSNHIISMNNRYYLCNSNLLGSTLDNGIIIYINKKWKNILVNIYIDDNTLPNISGVDRDDLYDDLYKKLTAYNFIQSINNIDNKNGYTDYISYVIIDENDNISNYSYTNNITSLPYLIRCNEPDEFTTKIDSLKKTPIPLSNELTLTKTLKDGKILNISQLNYFNRIPIAATIIENKFDPKVFENYHGNKNIVSKPVYRFSGFYMPLFYDIQLFEKDSEFRYVGNYKFDLSLTDFGMMKERKIRKINRKGSVLKLKEKNDIKSIYPMIDEFGYLVKDFFIFSSTWDYKYHIETIVLNTPPEIQILSPTIVPLSIGQPSLVQIQNLTF